MRTHILAPATRMKVVSHDMQLIHKFADVFDVELDFVPVCSAAKRYLVRQTAGLQIMSKHLEEAHKVDLVLFSCLVSCISVVDAIIREVFPIDADPAENRVPKTKVHDRSCEILLVLWQHRAAEVPAERPSTDSQRDLKLLACLFQL
eukprot:NODE_518_length_7331_cov_0.450913.p4 type:complete len:147 gc:universal NODE_518_length_7331_cov_0.450913:5226-5666(+)